ncbi:diguanylate cyclase [Halomonas meridiana]|uniref:sensor domain-containing diguanylate cyclase n=1 Tax=Halomonadaceae TaxID=28256 RepID=UPI000C40C0EB|nr:MULTISPECIES: diguanylate cyclase [Halomonas]MAO62501.1 sensor domain-containing diguanylate cyclase [Halomonas sp.]MDK9686847.1 diguanylate cyclase [Halomonas sp. LC1]MDP4556690.1 diguanylate cyclase [Halomonas meridiana]HBM27972.1 sensor domain-containing diguanylate cyclase [Halomonas sp.]
MSHLLPPNETARLAALNELALLDTPNEPVFDRITRLVTVLLGVPKSTISLIDTDRQWFKSQVGMEFSESPRDMAFCAYTVLEDEPLVVEDAQSDERFATNPIVTKPGGIRFYAGIPLRNSHGLVLGSLCAMDTQPRQLTPQEQAAMQDLADIVIGEIHLRERLINEQKIRAATQQSLTALHQSLEQRIEQRTRELNLVIESAYDAYLSIDAQGRVLDWNRAAESMFGWSRKDALTRPLTSLMFPQGLTCDDAAMPLTCDAIRRDGVRLPVEVRLKSFEVNGRPRRSVFIHDITERQQLERLRDQQAREDVLTRLPNRRALDERLPEAMARVRRTLAPLVVLFLDLDGFKRINDQHGHGMGDELLREVAQRLQNAVRETDFIARWAGDEFVVLLEGVTTEALEPLANKLIQVIEEPLHVGSATLRVSTSIGVALFVPNAAETPQELLKRADDAMYNAKRAGKARVALARPADTPNPL